MITSRVSRSALTIAGLAWILLGLHGPAAHALPFPASNGVADWFSMTDPAVAFMTYLRVIAIGLSWYLLVLAVAHLLVALTGTSSLLLDRLTPAMVRPLVGLVLTAATVPGLATPSLAEALGEPSPPVTMVRLDDPNATAPPSTSPPSTDPAPQAPERSLTMVGLGATTATAEAIERATWRVVEGEHFWSIANDVLTERLNRAPSKRELTAYWRDLIRANESRLVDPSNPDLLLVGQVLDLPG